MDPRFQGFSNSSNKEPMGELSDWELGNSGGTEINYPSQNNLLVNGLVFQLSNIGGVDVFSNPAVSTSTLSSSCLDTEDDFHEDFDFSDAVLRYIDQMLTEEDMEDKNHMLHESLDLQAQEKSFYEVLGKKYPPSPRPPPQSSLITHEYGETPSLYDCSDSYCDGNGYLDDLIHPRAINRDLNCDTSLVQCHIFDHVSDSAMHISNRFCNFADVFSDSPISPLQIREMISESHSIWNFKKGIEEASKFLPSGNLLLTDVKFNDLLVKGPTRESAEKAEIKGELGCSPSQSKGKKKSCQYLDGDLEKERNSKLPAIYTESDVPIEEFDSILLTTLGEHEKKFAAYRSDLQRAVSKVNRRAKGSSGGKIHGKKPNKKREVIDLRTILINCAQAVAADDYRNANELLKQIRQHSSPFGDGNQRLAHYFADGLEARLAGTGSQIHKGLVNRRTTAADYLKAYYTYLASSPFRKITNFASNKTIMLKAQKVTRVHVIDFGILYGFQWPTFIQRIAAREGGPPKLRITGIDFPQPGFRPAERIEETGQRLAHYAEKFNVPFEYNAIAQKWETINVEDLKIQKDEFVVVTCLYRSRNLLDESVVAESSRKMVLNLIKKINPNIFIHAILNGAYSTPFFVTRFREVLFHFSALFDMLDTNIPREKQERHLIEKDIFGREALNVIACEGWERVERPETYKQWQVRHLKAGFLHVPFEQEIVERAKYKVRSCYHKDFVIDEDGQWLLMGWKGRTIYAMSCWKPVKETE